MSGLLKKDFYMACKYCRSYLLIVVVFLAVSLFGNDNAFMVFYPCLLAGMVPVNLLAYDENSKWHIYSGSLPCTRGQLVSVKYLVGLITQLSVLVLTGIIQAAARMRPMGITDMEISSFMKKFKDKKFAAKCDRAIITKGCEMLGLEVRAVAEICIEAMKQYATELQIGPKA